MNGPQIDPPTRRRHAGRFSPKQTAILCVLEAGMPLLALAGMRWHVATHALLLAWLWSLFSLDGTCRVALGRGRSFREGLIVGLIGGPAGPIIERLLPSKPTGYIRPSSLNSLGVLQALEELCESWSDLKTAIRRLVGAIGRLVSALWNSMGATEAA
jgi:hypothetical protein